MTTNAARKPRGVPLLPILALAFLMVCFTLPPELRAAPVTLDFLEDDAYRELVEETYFEDGFRISIVRNDHYDLWYGNMQIDTHGSGDAATVRLDFFGNTFNFLRFDVDSWRPNPGELDLDEIAFVTSSAGGYATITDVGVMNFSGSKWRHVSWIDFSVLDPNVDLEQDNLMFDNIRLTVPEPSVMLLLVAGLVGVVALRRKLPS